MRMIKSSLLGCLVGSAIGAGLGAIALDRVVDKASGVDRWDKAESRWVRKRKVYRTKFDRGMQTEVEMWLATERAAGRRLRKGAARYKCYSRSMLGSWFAGTLSASGVKIVVGMTAG